MIYLLLVYFAVRVFGEFYDFVTGYLYNYCTSYLLCGNSRVHDPSICNFLHKFLQCGRGCGLESAQSYNPAAQSSLLLEEQRQDFVRSHNNQRTRRKHKFHIWHNKSYKEFVEDFQTDNLDIKGCILLKKFAHTHHISGPHFRFDGLNNSLYSSRLYEDAEGWSEAGTRLRRYWLLL